MKPEIEHLKLAGYHNISSGRRLQLALAESYIRQSSYQEGKDVLDSLKGVLEGIKDPDIIAKRARFRIWSGLARIAHMQSQWHEALHYWDLARGALEILGRKTGSQPGIVHCSIADTLISVEREDEANEALEKGRTCFLEEGERRFWIVGLQSYWRDYIVQHVTPKRIQSISTQATAVESLQ